MKAFSSRRLGWTVLTLYAILVILYLLTPLIVLVSMAFNSTGILTFPPVGFSTKWFPAALQITDLVDSFVTSLKLALLAAFLSAVLGTLAALAIANRRFRGKALVTSFFLSPLIFPTIVVGVALLQYYRTLHYDDVFMTLLLGHIVVTIPYTVRTVTASLEVFDYTLLDAARALGADTLRTFTEVMLPIIKPGVFSGAVFAFLISFDNYTVSMFLANARTITLPIRIFNYSQMSIDPSIAAASAIMILVSIVMFVGMGRLIGVRGLARF